VEQATAGKGERQGVRRYKCQALEHAVLAIGEPSHSRRHGALPKLAATGHAGGIQIEPTPEK
jgi:hypothetical protein